MRPPPGSIRTRPLAEFAFSAFGEIIVTPGAVRLPINDGRCVRHHALAEVDVDDSPVISVFESEAVAFPYALTLLERHPLGSQAFVPLGPDRWMIVVAPDEKGVPGMPMAFIVPPGVGVNLRRGVWHAPLTPLDQPARFLVVDRGGADNLQEHKLPEPLTVIEAI
ncbi:ureidoglycolate lyase [Rubrimonas cliftonensis]|uniref:Ureidoglycolate lyase n=1 Tax=Rubrimonas cliftonensis TaxID=89524 RepID=A0A1H3Z6M2_9RHOB|nr:ureidoglycolate lyase [Rubrimonas cliftonensis]SEA18932.1 ureidoglycolate lyase [Rubrimonas cliftonensis]